MKTKRFYIYNCEGVRNCGHPVIAKNKREAKKGWKCWKHSNSRHIVAEEEKEVKK